MASGFRIVSVMFIFGFREDSRNYMLKISRKIWKWIKNTKNFKSTFLWTFLTYVSVVLRKNGRYTSGWTFTLTKHMLKNWNRIDYDNCHTFWTRGQFHQLSTSSFCECRSQKRKKNDNLPVFFALLGLVCVKSDHRMFGEIDTRFRTTQKNVFYGVVSF